MDESTNSILSRQFQAADKGNQRTVCKILLCNGPECGILLGRIFERGIAMHEYIRVRGARENNLKNVDLTIPRDKLVVFTGLSGSGKSSLAFDTIFAEGQRRYVESLSSYARQFLGQMDKPDVDSIDGLSPAISIDQDNVKESPVHCGHSNGGLRLSAPFVGKGWYSSLPQMWKGNPQTNH